MHVILLTGEFPPIHGGVADYTLHLAEHLVTDGHRCQVLCTAQDVRFTPFSAMPAAPIDMEQVVPYIRATTPDLVIVQYVPHLYGRGGIVPQATKVFALLSEYVRTIVVMHELYSPWGRRPRDWLRSAFHRVQLRTLAESNATMVATTSPGFAAIERLGPRTAPRMIPVGPGIIPTRTPRLERRMGVGNSANEAPLVVDFSYMGTTKEPGHLVALMDAVPDVRLVCIGGIRVNSERIQSFKDRMRTSPAGKRVELHGYENPTVVSAVLAESDIYVHTVPAGASTGSSTLASAFAHGLPVVAFAGKATPELYRSACELVELGDLDGWCNAVRLLAADPERRETLRKAALSISESFQSWPRIVRAMVTEC